MATQGILSVMIDDRVILKAVTGLDGYEMPAIGDEVVTKMVTKAQDLLNLCHEHGLGGDSLIVQSSPTEWIGGDSDELPEWYAAKFHDPRFNPRWRHGTADYIVVVDLTKRLVEVDDGTI